VPPSGLTELWNTRDGRLSTQVLQEFYVNVTQKIKVPLSRSAAREVVRNYTPWVESAITPATVFVLRKSAKYGGSRSGTA